MNNIMSHQDIIKTVVFFISKHSSDEQCIELLKRMLSIEQCALCFIPAGSEMKILVRIRKHPEMYARTGQEGTCLKEVTHRGGKVKSTDIYLGFQKALIRAIRGVEMRCRGLVIYLKSG